MSTNILCNWCGSVIQGMPVTAYTGEHFCTLACGKLYYDNVGVFSYDAVDYNKLFVDNKLSQKAREVYIKVGHNMIAQLPYYKCEDKLTPEYKCDIRDRYIKLLKLIRNIS